MRNIPVGSTNRVREERDENDESAGRRKAGRRKAGGEKEGGRGEGGREGKAAGKGRRPGREWELDMEKPAPSGSTQHDMTKTDLIHSEMMELVGSTMSHSYCNKVLVSVWV